ncbi:hypothetical protein GCM10011490_24340 [Pseudoclavibacter endophyticus]|uniref:Uncharacterized protein n=1 Tax=Pseudoclavibacter endophyticus TaxID=1778590 RepID=A0A6H9WQW7_9MICO|nr:hypothetical protein [Pseudoclavibacter endophyticus]KAB1648435.1 hypothetical protein F8O04_12175 [Pseudoclavibacter endophyticus]GGA72693.1 hypothetical protein GCM10011490_24340 [Pseudoclavibacter endophyticus]
MAELPANLKYSTVVGNVLAVAPDGDDVGTLPDAEVLHGVTVTLDPVRSVWAPDTESNTLLLLRSYTLTSGMDGTLTNAHTGLPGVQVVSSEELGGIPYRVTVNAKENGVPKWSGYLHAPAGETVDITDAVVDAPGGTSLPEWVKLRNETAALIKTIPTKATEAVDAAVVAWTASLTGTATRTIGASAGTVSLEKVGTRVIAAVTGLTKAGTVEHVATLPAAFQPAHTQGHGWLADGAGAWWPAHVTSTQLIVLGPPPAGTVLTGSLTWKAAS